MNKHLYLCHPLVLSSPTLMMHGHTNLKFVKRDSVGLTEKQTPKPLSFVERVFFFFVNVVFNNCHLQNPGISLFS